VNILADILNYLVSTNNSELALEILNILSKSPVDNEEMFIMANLYMRFGKPEESIVLAEKILGSNPEKEVFGTVMPFLISAYRAASRAEKAIPILDEVYENNKSVEILLEKAGCLFEINNKKEAVDLLESLDDSTLNEHQLSKKNTYMASELLRRHEFKEGIKGIVFEHDKLRSIESGREVFHTKKELPLEFWLGTNDCKNLIIFAEAGLGDEIINIRFMNELKKRGINAKWYGHWHLNAKANKRFGAAEWFKKSGFDVITDFTPEKYKNYMWTYSQYLPILLDLDEKDLWNGKYMKAGKKKLPKGKKNIGIRWSGNPFPMHRNFPVKDLYKVMKDYKANFYSLQKDFDMDELKDFPGIIDLSQEIEDFNDTVDYINSFDLTITCCTCTCPAAGALDKECITMVPISDYYIFNTADNKTPWFSDKMTLVRQKTSRRWDDVMDEVRSLVEEKLGK
jgi:tetratricopeptide (TPR) repeat protein